MTQINVKTETQAERGWTFAVEVRDNGKSSDYTVSLSWSDYDHWSHGRVAPEHVVRSVFEFLLAREPAAEIGAKFDCAVVRRYFPEVDAELPGLL